MLPSRDNKFSKNTRISPLIHENLFFLKTYYLVKEASDWSETFRDCYLSLDLHIDKNSDRNIVIRFLSICPDTGWNFSKTTITRKERPISPYHFKLLLASLGSTYAQSISSKAISKLVPLPRKIVLYFFKIYCFVCSMDWIFDSRISFNDIDQCDIIPFRVIDIYRPYV